MTFDREAPEMLRGEDVPSARREETMAEFSFLGELFL